MNKWKFFTTKEIKPRGWLRSQLRVQADGLAGNLDKVWRDVRDSAWIGGNADGWERVPYWLDGFIPLAYLLEDEDMIAYYAQLAASLGGKAMAYYLDGFAVKTPSGISTYMKTREEARSGAFWLTDRPHEKRRPGWPLDSISLMPDGSYFLDRQYKLKSKPCNDIQTKKSWVRFLADALGL